MATIREGYIKRNERRIGAHNKERKPGRDWWLGSKCISLKVYVPQDLQGKRLRFKVETID